MEPKLKVSQMTAIFSQQNTESHKFIKSSPLPIQVNKFASTRALFEQFAQKTEQNGSLPHSNSHSSLPIHCSGSQSNSTGGNPPQKPLPPAKPPQLNSRSTLEMIEKQRNWISHFSQNTKPKRKSGGFDIKPLEIETKLCSPLMSPKKSPTEESVEEVTVIENLNSGVTGLESLASLDHFSNQDEESFNTDDTLPSEEEIEKGSEEINITETYVTLDYNTTESSTDTKDPVKPVINATSSLPIYTPVHAQLPVLIQVVKVSPPYVPPPVEIKAAPPYVPPPVEIKIAPPYVSPSIEIKAAPSNVPSPVEIKAAPQYVSPPVEIQKAPCVQPTVEIKAAPPFVPAPVEIKTALPFVSPPVEIKTAPSYVPPPVEIKTAPPYVPPPVEIKAARPYVPPPLEFKTAPPNFPRSVEIKTAPPNIPHPVEIKTAHPYVPPLVADPVEEVTSSPIYVAKTSTEPSPIFHSFTSSTSMDITNSTKFNECNSSIGNSMKDSSFLNGNDKDIFQETDSILEDEVKESRIDAVVNSSYIPETPVEDFEVERNSTLEESSIYLNKYEDTTALTSADVTDVTTNGHFVSTSDFLSESGQEMYYEDGVHYLDDGHYWVEVPGIPKEEQDEDFHNHEIVKKQPMRVRWDEGPIKVFTTYSVTDYDRRNDEVDPASAAAEYELEKRVEKMDIFEVELIKGVEGLGLSIIGMGVGADAGLEKLGIFIKTITGGGAAEEDGRIQVNDQIIEVDGKSLVGVTQSYAASILRNTIGVVKFQIGRERDPENSEVAQLIRQSLQSDREREEKKRINHPPPPPPPPEIERYKKQYENSLLTELELKSQIQQLETKLSELESQSQVNAEEIESNLATLVKKEEELKKFKSKYSHLKCNVKLMKRRLELHGESVPIELSDDEDFMEFDEVERHDLLDSTAGKCKAELASKGGLAGRQKATKPIELGRGSASFEGVSPTRVGVAPESPDDTREELGRSSKDTPIRPEYLGDFIKEIPLRAEFISPEREERGNVELGNQVKEERTKIEFMQPMKEGEEVGKIRHEFIGHLVKDIQPQINVDFINSKEEQMKVEWPGLPQSEFRMRPDFMGHPIYREGHPIHREGHPIHREGHLIHREGHPMIDSNGLEYRYNGHGNVKSERSEFTRQPAPPIPLKSELPKATQEYTVNSLTQMKTDFPTAFTPDFGRHGMSVEYVKHSPESPFRGEDYMNAPPIYHRPPPVNYCSPESLSGFKHSMSDYMKPIPTASISPTVIKPNGQPPNSFRLPFSQPAPPTPTNVGVITPSKVEEKWMNISVLDWANEQVCQWLMFMNLEHLIPPFMDNSLTGPDLLRLTSKELKIYGVSGDDKLKIKKKIKEMKIVVEKEKKVAEKERKEQEKNAKKKK